MRVIRRCPQLDKKPGERDPLTRMGEGPFARTVTFQGWWLLFRTPATGVRAMWPKEQQIHTRLPKEQMHRLCRTSHPCGTDTKIKPHPHPNSARETHTQTFPAKRGPSLPPVEGQTPLPQESWQRTRHLPAQSRSRGCPMMPGLGGASFSRSLSLSPPPSHFRCLGGGLDWE